MQLNIDLRPHRLSEVYGHTNIVKSLVNRSKENNWPTATLMKGFSGTGKTSMTHIMAMMMNCQHLEENGDACLKCPSCLSVLEERFDRDIQLLNGGQSSKDEVIDFTQYASAVPFYDRNKSIFIIEEADQLSTKAMNALLKTLETPMENVHFILLSMSTKGIDLPNASRCQSYSFSPFMKKDILLGLQSDLKKIGKWGIPEIPKSFYVEVLPAIASSSRGSYRQALQDVESCLYGEAWTPDEYTSLTGAFDAQSGVDLLEDLLNKKKAFFVSLEGIGNFQEFFNVSFDMIAKAYVYKKTGIIKNEYFEDQIKAISSHPDIEKVMDTFTAIYEANTGYTRRSHAISYFAKLY